MITVRSDQETIATLRQRFESGKPFSYNRYGDVDLLLIGDETFKGGRRHTARPQLRKELRQSFMIRDPDYLIGCVAGGRVFPKAKERRFGPIAEKLVGDDDITFESAVAYHWLYRADPAGFVEFNRACFRDPKVLLIAGESVAKNQLVLDSFFVDASIKLTDTEAFTVLAHHMPKIVEQIPHFDIVISALGQATRVLAGRLWRQDIQTMYFDVGSAIDALAERPLRSWIRRLPKSLQPYYKAAFLGRPAGAVLEPPARETLMKRVILESPFAGDIERNTTYARRAVHDSVHRGEAPIASHLLYTQPGILDDFISGERQLGIDAGHAWLDVAEGVVFYADYGMSSGMELGMERARAMGLSTEVRTIGENPET